MYVGEQTTSALEAREWQLEQTVATLTDSLVDKQSMIDTLQLQVIIYREDFQTERRDRERAQSHIADLQAQIDDLIQSQHRTSATATQPQVRRLDITKQCTSLSLNRTVYCLSLDKNI